MDPCTFLHTLCNVWLFENSQFTSHAMLQALNTLIQYYSQPNCHLITLQKRNSFR